MSHVMYACDLIAILNDNPTMRVCTRVNLCDDDFVYVELVREDLIRILTGHRPQDTKSLRVEVMKSVMFIEL